MDGKLVLHAKQYHLAHGFPMANNMDYFVNDIIRYII